MPLPIPSSLEALLEAHDERVRDQAWADFLHDYSDLIRYVARRLGGDEDLAMDRYAFVLGALRENDFHRLRQFRSVGRGKFSTWLVAVTRRLCIDEHRRRYGRPQSDHADGWKTSRKNLAELVSAEIALDQIETPEEPADRMLEQGETLSALLAALARLSPGERLLLRYRFEHGLSVPEIARVTGRPSPFPVYREIEKVLAHLREQLDGAGVEWSR